MYVLVHHNVTDRQQFWASAQAALPNLPEYLQLHHTVSAADGSRATCVWEADSVAAVREFLEPVLSASSNNEYAEAVNRDGIGIPPGYEAVQPQSIVGEPTGA
jgi:hypothetical protein